MKNTYLKPIVKVLRAISDDLLTGSVTGDPNGGIGYGGVDDTGEKDPDAKDFDLPDNYTDYSSVWFD